MQESKQAGMQTGRYAGRQAGRQTERQAGRQKGRKAERQAFRQGRLLETASTRGGKKTFLYITRKLATTPSSFYIVLILCI